MVPCLALAEKAVPHLRLVQGADPAGNRIEDSMRGIGYVVHIAGCGKTLTFFKASTLVKVNPCIALAA